MSTLLVYIHTGVTINEDNKLVITLSEGDPIIIDKSVVGADGKDGNGISKVTLTEDFCLVFDYTDGTSSDKIGPIKGADGANGADGLTPILTLDNESGDLSVKYGENGNLTLLGNIKGAKGDKGDKGDTGADGRGIADITYSNGKFIFTYTDGTTKEITVSNSGSGGSESETSGMLKFIELSNDTYAVKAGAKASEFTTIEIPPTYNGKSVTQILSSGFKDLTDLQTIIIPDSINEVLNDAFEGCNNIKEVKYGGTVSEWSQITFGNLKSNPNENCGNLYIGNNLITDAVITDGITEIKDYTFYNCRSLTTLTLPDTLLTIGNSSFYKTNITTVTVPNNVKKIKEYAFYDAPLTNIYFKNQNGWSIGENRLPFKISYGQYPHYYSIDESEWMAKFISKKTTVPYNNGYQTTTTTVVYYDVVWSRS